MHFCIVKIRVLKYYVLKLTQINTANKRLLLNATCHLIFLRNKTSKERQCHATSMICAMLLNSFKEIQNPHAKLCCMSLQKEERPNRSSN